MTRRASFDTVTIRGGLLPTGLLDRVGKNDSDLEGVAPTDYHLAHGERLGEAITRSWNRLLGVWERFTDRTANDGGALTGPTRQEWLLPLFQELGYGQLQNAPRLAIETKAYPISHLWESVPIHLVGAGVDVDRRSPGVPGAATTSPHGLVQEYLNRSEEYQWGIVSNGRRLRLLRDNASLTRSAFVEFDLEEMFVGEVFSDFTLLWLTCHASRLEGPAGKHLLERWREDSARQGVRAMDALRDGVETAIATLGSAAAGHPSNLELRRRLESEDLDPQDLYRQLLRVVYRVLFLLVTESRGLLLDPGGDPLAKQRYRRYYSITRLRDLAETTRGTNHTDLWRQLQVVSNALESHGESALGLLPLGGFLWATESTEALNAVIIPNSALLDALRALTTVKVNGGVAQRVDYANLGSEELGSIYESLLELHPEVNPVTGRFSLTTAAGNERKTTGSYYTPTPLITELLNSALDPVLDRATRQPDAERAILNLKVVDPAAGSGHFLIAAANRIADRLARIRADDEEPSPEQLRTAIRDVVAHCIYAVDINPMAVELAKVALWLEAMEPGKPLTFLDHHIVCGNSLLGVTPKLLEEGVPDDAFQVLTGDDKEQVRKLRKHSRDERKKKGLVALPFGESADDILQRASKALTEIDALGDASLDDVEEKRHRHEALLESVEQRRLRLAADAWVAAFVSPKTTDVPPLTHLVINTTLTDPDQVAGDVVEMVEGLANEMRFHHWHLAFPDVFTGQRGSRHPQAGWFGGFDVVLGNPPWERVKLQEKEFFANSAPKIAKAANKATRTKLINQLRENNPSLWESFQRALHQSEAESHFLRKSQVYPLCGRGDVNTYTVFAEGMRTITGPTGRTGVIVPTGIATDDTTKHFFADLVETKSLVSLFDFENRKKIFPGIDSRIKFCLLTLAGIEHPVEEAEFSFFALDTGDLSDPERRFTLTPEDFALLNPNTRTCPTFRTRRDADITKGIYRRVPVLLDDSKEDGNPWDITFQRMFDMSNDSHLFRAREQLEADGWRLEGNVFIRGDERCLPLYEAKMATLLDHRASNVVISATAVSRQGQPEEIPEISKVLPTTEPTPRFWVPEPEVERRLNGLNPSSWLIGWRRISIESNARTVVPTVFPKSGVGDSIFLLFVSPPHVTSAFAIPLNLALFVFDYVARQKIGGLNLSYYIMEQLPVLPPSRYGTKPSFLDETLREWLLPRVFELVATSNSMGGFSHDLGHEGRPFRWGIKRRLELMSEVDAVFFHLYGLDRDGVEYIMETFPIVKRKDIAEHGSYRTKELILEAYDRMAKAIESGESYQTILDPPPADSSLCHPPRISP